MINLSSKSGIISIPTKLEEINIKLLNKLYEDINLPEDYCIIALIQKVKLSQISLITSTKAKETNVYTIPIVGKLPKSYNYKGDINVTDKVIISKSSIEMATHLNMSHSITFPNLFNFINSDTKLKASCYQHNIKDLDGNEDVWVYIIESKIVPMCDIRATIPLLSTSKDPFKIEFTPTKNDNNIN